MASAPASDSAPAWQFAPAGDFKPPAPPVGYAAQSGLAALWRRLRSQAAKPEAPLKADSDLQTLPEAQARYITPLPRWDEAAAALETELSAWLEADRPDRPVVFLIGPPHGGQTEIVQAAAEAWQWRMLDRPTPDQILAGDESWLAQSAGADRPWVLAGLERCYLRHETGLATIRDLLDRMSSGQMGRGLVACDSWAWAFLRKIWRGRAIITLSQQPFDGARLTTCLQNLARGRQRLYRQSNNGHYILPPADPDAEAIKTSDFLQHLAAFSRGNLGVALAFWRACLRTTPDDGIAEEVEAESESSRQATIWVTPWSQIHQPPVPSSADGDQAFILHALLLHNGLPAALLPRLLPIAPSRVNGLLLQLADAGLVEQVGDVWQVAPLGYPAVRQFLLDDGYLTDEF